MEILDEKGVLSMEVLPAGFEETKRSKIQQVLIDGDIEGLLTTPYRGLHGRPGVSGCPDRRVRNPPFKNNGLSK